MPPGVYKKRYMTYYAPGGKRTIECRVPGCRKRTLDWDRSKITVHFAKNRGELEDKVAEVVTEVVVLDLEVIVEVILLLMLLMFNLLGSDEGLVVGDAVPLAVLPVEVGEDAAEVAPADNKKS